ncbi:MAG: outer membrane protein [Xanthobacteraceae bacterium]
MSSAVVIFAVAGAQAADMPGDHPLPLPAEHSRMPVFKALHGWYLRGDIGYRFSSVDAESSLGPASNPTDNKLDGTASFTLGGGLKVDWFRTDLTVDYAGPAKYHGMSVTANDTTAKVQSMTLLANGYFDLGSWYGFTPYVGAGVGSSFIRVNNYVSPLPPTTETGARGWSFSYAGMAGVAFAVSRNIMLDIGYRYLNLGDAPAVHDATGSFDLKDLQAHEIRVGLRWYFDDIDGWR